MDVRYFLEQRTVFVRHYFDEASAPFLETIRKIDAGEAPFEPPHFDPETMSDEPAFLDEWLRAQTGLEVVGQTCVSMLSESLKVLFATYERNAGLDCENECGRAAFAKGFIRGYRICFAKHGVNWANCPADFSILEQVVLARNTSQHVNWITDTRANHKPATLRKYPSPLFVSDYEKDLMKDCGGRWLIDPAIHVTREDLHAAIGEVEKLAVWLEQ
ncbi:hypothetical protein BLL42_28525 (plasmid) [Pseudomonas frederiksbergensis]|uniref:Uncharacterized protein n=1 Tax=Pseudomonas frederiksbergensis TaxID=104087 RepID=A0A1J0EV60_9PSED|nr:hypothetical protein [Pseudomonas frederiksbergensis]APC19369.1 hypothetical protein BLL42_26880 [Pseudomonas frederiksbergensis]APC19652.1 hypothetical protein BLL42_28525 [Pseudomonas frederiksbergensis]